MCKSILIIGLVVCSLVAVAEGEDSSPNLEAILAATLKNNGQIREAGGDVQVAREQLAQARAAFLPRASGMVLAAPIFEERGNAIQSTPNWSKWGPFITGGLSVVQPIFTFGQLSGYKTAAEKQIEAREGQQEMKRAEIVLLAKEFFYGYQMATELDDLVEDLSKFLSEAVETAEKNMKKKKSTQVKPHDFYRLQTALDDLKQKGLHAKQARKTAMKALNWVSGLNFESISGKKLKPVSFEKKTLEDYVTTSKAKRPEYKALRAGQEAYTALSDAKQAQSYPVVFAGAFLQQGWSPVRDKQPSVFANDPFNQTQGGLGLGLKFDLEFWRHSAEAAEQRAEGLKLEAKESYAIPGMELQVKKAFWEFEQAEAGLEIAENRKKTAQKWFVSNAMGWSIGITPAKDLLESLEGSGLARKNYIETVYAYNYSIAQLSLAVGEELASLQY